MINLNEEIGMTLKNWFLLFTIFIGMLTIMISNSRKIEAMEIKMTATVKENICNQNIDILKSFKTQNPDRNIAYSSDHRHVCLYFSNRIAHHDL